MSEGNCNREYLGQFVPGNMFGENVPWNVWDGEMYPGNVLRDVQKVVRGMVNTHKQPDRQPLLTGFVTLY